MIIQATNFMLKFVVYKKLYWYTVPRLQINNMADDLDIEAMLEAPYKKVGVCASKWTRTGMWIAFNRNC